MSDPSTIFQTSEHNNRNVIFSSSSDYEIPSFEEAFNKESLICYYKQDELSQELHSEIGKSDSSQIVLNGFSNKIHNLLEENEKRAYMYKSKRELNDEEATDGFESGKLIDLNNQSLDDFVSDFANLNIETLNSKKKAREDPNFFGETDAVEKALLSEDKEKLYTREKENGDAGNKVIEELNNRIVYIGERFIDHQRSKSVEKRSSSTVAKRNLRRSSSVKRGNPQSKDIPVGTITDARIQNDRDVNNLVIEYLKLAYGKHSKQ